MALGFVIFCVWSWSVLWVDWAVCRIALLDPGCCPEQNLGASHTRAETQANSSARKWKRHDTKIKETRSRQTKCWLCLIYIDLSFRLSKRWLQRVQELCGELAVLAWHLAVGTNSSHVCFRSESRCSFWSQPNNITQCMRVIHRSIVALWWPVRPVD